jgi:Kef-type K+ transport system membrane component KefB
MKKLLTLLAPFVCCALPLLAQAADHAGSEHGGTSRFLFEIVTILIAAKIGGEIFERLNQPAVLGELIFGVALGNLNLLGIDFMQGFKTDESLALAAEIGVILLLFEVGLESNIDELMAVGGSAMLVACMGVVAPVILGYGVSMWYLPDHAWYVHAFVGATLAATSVGITARVLKDMRKMETQEARIILGAAVVDDVLGLIILAVVSGLITSIAAGGASEISLTPVLWIIGKAVAFLAISILLGRALAGRVIQWGSRAKGRGIPVVLTISYCFVMAGIAESIGLAAIVGAFAAGLVLDQTHYVGYRELKAQKIEDLLAPVSAIYVPVFFVLMGLRVDLSVFGSLDVLEFAAALSLAAILGKQVCAFGILEKGLNRIAVGVGMIPRGEVGLIFAGIGATLMVNGEPIFSSDTFSAMIVMVMVTTLATPPLLKAVFSK